MTDRYFERFLDPWREFERMSRLLRSASSNGTNEFPAVNIWVKGDHAVMTTELPGVDRESLDISVSGNTLTLSGERPTYEIGEGEAYHRHELWHGKFSKTIQVPFNIDSEKVHASYRRGVLSIALTQREADKPRKITIS